MFKLVGTNPTANLDRTLSSEMTQLKSIFDEFASELEGMMDHIDVEFIKSTWEYLSIHFPDAHIKQAKVIYLELCAYSVSDKDKINSWFNLQELASPSSRELFVLKSVYSDVITHKIYQSPFTSLNFMIIDVPYLELDSVFNKHISRDNPNFKDEFLNDVKRDNTGENDAFFYNGKALTPSVIEQLEIQLKGNFKAVATLTKQGLDADVLKIVIPLVSNKFFPETASKSAVRRYDITTTESEAVITYYLYKDLSFCEKESLQMALYTSIESKFVKSVEMKVTIAIKDGQATTKNVELILGSILQNDSTPFITRPL